MPDTNQALGAATGNFAEQVKMLPIGDMVRDIAMGVAKAQAELDANSIKMLREFSKKDIDLFGDGSKMISLLDLGFGPHFLYFQKVHIKVHMELSFHIAEESSKNFGLTASIGYEKTTSTGGGGGNANTGMSPTTPTVSSPQSDIGP
jgi:hypothetical protein